MCPLWIELCLLPSKVTPAGYVFPLPILASEAPLRILLGSNKNLGLLQITPLAGNVPGAPGLPAKPPVPANLLKEGGRSEQNLGLKVEAGLGPFQHSLCFSHCSISLEPVVLALLFYRGFCFCFQRGN